MGYASRKFDRSSALFIGPHGVLLLTGCGGADVRKSKHLEKGREFLRQSNFEKARIEFRNALQISPNDSEARYENGVIDEKLQNPREAAQFYQGAIDSNADNVRARSALGRLYLFSGAPDRALELIKPAFLEHPADAELLTVRAAARVQMKDLDGALADAEQAVKLAPSDENAVAVLAGVYESKGEPDKARALLEGASKQLPNSVDLRLALAQIYARLDQPAQVESILLDILRVKPQDKANRLRLSQFYVQSKHYDEAEKVLRDAVKALPGEDDLKLALVDFLAAQRGRDVAQKELEGMIAAAPKDFELKLTEATFQERGKDLAAARQVFERIIADRDAGASANVARTRLAALELQQNDVVGGRKLLDEVLSNSPRDNDALILRGELALTQKDPKSAIADLRAVLRDQPNSVGVMRTLARAHLANGEPALAEETMRAALDLNPKDPNTRQDLAQLLLLAGKPELAKPVIDELVKQQPNNFTALNTQFRTDAAVNDIAGAKSAADAMVALQPESSIGYYYQGAAAESAKHLDDAVRFYSMALDTQPDAIEPLQALCNLLVRLNRSAEALKRLDAEAIRNPRSAFASNLKGELLLAAKRVPEAQQAFRVAVGRDPKWWAPYDGLAGSQASLHDESAAIATLQSGISKASQPETLHIDLARIYESEGKPELAIPLYELALRVNPQVDIAANNLAMILITYKSDRASLDRARDLSQRFSASANPAFLDTYGWVLYKRGESAAALTVLQAAQAKLPESPVFLYHLGMVQASVGEDAAARDSLSLSLKTGRAFSGMDEAKATLTKLAKMAPNNTAPKS